MQLSLLVLFLLTPQLLSQLLTGTITTTITPANTTINTRTAYNFYISLELASGSVPKDSYIVITFPLDYNAGTFATGVTYLNSTSDFLSTDNSYSASGIQVTYNAFTFKLQNVFTYPMLYTQTFAVGYTMYNILNPAPVKTTNNFTVAFYNPSNVLLISDSTQNITLTAGFMTCSVTPQMTQVWSTSPFIFTITPTNAFPSTGIMKVTFPHSWDTDGLDTLVLNTASPSCYNTSTLAYIGCTQTDTDEITFTNIVSTTTTSTISFTFASAFVPPSEQPTGPIQIKSYDGSNRQLDSCSVSVTGVTAGVLTSVSLSFTSNVGGNAIGTLQFTTSKVNEINDQIYVTFPWTISLSSLSSAFFYHAMSADSLTLHPDTATNSVYFQPFTSTASSQSCKITFNNLTAPPSNQASGNIIVSTRRNGYNIQTVSCCSITATANALISVTINPTVFTVNSVTNYTFLITTTTALSSTGYLVVQFPADYSLASSTGTCVAASGTNVSSTPTCTITAPRLLTVTNLLTSSLSGASSISITAGSITNPATPATTGTFLVSTYYSATAGIVDTHSSVTLNIAPASITSVVVTPSNNITNQAANYTFQINNKNPLLSGSFLQISVPTDITFSGVACYANTSIPLTCPIMSLTSFNVTNLFNSSMTAGQLLNTPITIVGFTNPKTFQPTGSFSVTIYNSAYTALQSMTSGITVTMSVAATFSPLTIAPSSFSVGASTTYTLTASSPFTLPNNTNITILFPAQYTVPVSPSCTAVTNLNSIDCSSTNSPVTTLLPLSITTSTFSLRIASITNPLSLSASSAIVVSVYISGYLSIQQSYTLSSFVANSITYSMTQTATTMADPSSVTLTITTTNTIPPTSYLATAGYLSITIPSEYNYASVTCGTIIGITSPVCTPTANVLKITGSTFMKSIVVTINSLTNPSQSTSSNFGVASYDASNNAIDSASTNSKFGITCTLPCKTCSNPASSTACLSCYSAASVLSVVSNRIYLDSTSCVTNCNSSAYFDASNICRACNSNCLTCSQSSTNCTSCPITSKYMLVNVCYATCPSTYYADTATTQCLACTNNCTTCSSISTCLSCSSPYYLNASSCISACPPLMYSDSNRVCQNCPSNCASCSASGCLVCNSLYLLYLGSCYSNCPGGLYPDVSATSCITCSSSCLTCAGTASNCSSCNTASSLKALYSGSCLTSCPAGYYYNNGVCTGCTSPCSQCSSSVTCTSCISTHKLYQGTCYLTCPGNTIQVATDCYNCTSPCLTCSVSPTNCVSCVPGYFLNSSTCQTSCNSPYYAINSKCVLCADPCLFCPASDPYNCTACQANYYLLGSVCYLTCPSGTYTDFPNGKCQVCSSSCATCTNSTNCTSCISGKFLFNYACYDTCPSTPVYYYAYQSMCLACQPQCTSCLTTPVECSSCSSALYLLNTQTRACTFACDTGYYKNGTQCIPCQLPCKTCDTVFNVCATCYNSNYLYSGTCIITCPDGYYSQDSNNTCVACSYPCATCSIDTCFTCVSPAKLYSKSCYTSCPPSAPYTSGDYCTNCPSLAGCMTCSSSKSIQYCQQCISPALLYSGYCVSTCPTNYQPNTSGSVCIPTSTYITYLESIELDRKKNLPFPFTIILLALCLSLLVGKCMGKQIYTVGFLVASVGALGWCSWILLLVFVLIYGSPITYAYLLISAILVMNVVINLVNLIPVFKLFKNDTNFKIWESQSKNLNKQHIILAFSGFCSFKLSRLLFCRYFDVPVFCARLLAVDKFHFWNRINLASIFFSQLPAIGVALLLAFNEPAYNTKVFIESAEVGFLAVLQSILLLADLRKDEYNFFKQRPEDLLWDVSVKKRAGQSGGNNDVLDIGEGGFDQLKRLSKTMSQSDLNAPKTEYELLEDDYKSVYDPNDYQDVPIMPKFKIPQGIQKGKFRKRGRKKKEYDLDTIREDDSQDEEEAKKREKKKRKNNGPLINHWLYFKSPKKTKEVQIKAKPLQVEEIYDEEKIFDTIRKKQSEFDILSKNDDFFIQPQRTRYGGFNELDQDGSKMSIDISMEEPMIDDHNRSSKNIMFSIDPDDLMNLNYARKKHIVKNSDNSHQNSRYFQSGTSERQDQTRKLRSKKASAFARVGNMTLRR